jgi:hypothetical protein
MPSRRRLVPVLLAVAAGGGSLFAAGPALAASSTPPTPAPGARAGQSADKAVDQRLTSLAAWQKKIAADKTLTAAHRSALTALLQQDVTGLTALRAKLDGDTDPAVRRSDAATIFTGYRVYALLARQVQDTVAGDRMAAAVTPLKAAQQRLTARTAAQPGGGTDAEKAALADLGTQVGALGAGAGAGDAVLALHPVDVPDPAHLPAALTGADESVKAGRAAASKARADVKTLRGALPKAGQRTGGAKAAPTAASTNA